MAIKIEDLTPTVDASIVAGFAVESNFDKGYNKITLPKDYYLLRKGNSNFWEVLKESGEVDEIYFDYAIEYGVNYTYRAIKIKEEQKYGDIKCYNLYEDMFILNSTESLAIRYNPDVSSYKYNIIDTITPTLGSPYPFVRRNGH
jgi:hypothetical protein